MVKKRVGRPRKRGRPKGSKNKTSMSMEVFIENRNRELEASKLSLASRLDECMTRLENAVAEAISKLKEMI